jgi:hypothetical protein
VPFSEQEDAEFAVVWLAVKRYDEGVCLDYESLEGRAVVVRAVAAI